MKKSKKTEVQHGTETYNMAVWGGGIYKNSK